MDFVFREGVVLRLTKAKYPTKVVLVDTWKSDQQERVTLHAHENGLTQDDWYATPAGPQQEPRLVDQAKDPSKKPSAAEESKRRKKHLRRAKQQRKASAGRDAATAPASTADPQVAFPGEDVVDVGKQTSPDYAAAIEAGSPEIEIAVPCSGGESPNEPLNNQPPSVLPADQSHTSPVIRTPVIPTIQLSTPPVVASLSPAVQPSASLPAVANASKLEQTESVNIDPALSLEAGCLINLFNKFEKNLPVPDVGNILLLRLIQGDSFSGTPCGVAPSYKSWSWAIFDPQSGEVPRSSVAMNFKPSPRELQYCIRLGDWYRAIKAHQQLQTTDVTVYQIPGEFVHASSKRMHRLISEVLPDTEPQGFFDCTIQVVHGVSHNDDMYSLYVTDFTRNPSVSPIDSDWCPPKLSDYVLKMAMWGTAAKVGPEMEPGQYYFIGNARMKFDSGGYLEAKINEGQKVRRLNEDELEGEPYLEALLRREADWKARAEASGGMHEFPHQLIEEAQPNKHFQCTVEVVFISHKDDHTYLYVTDYTSRSDLVPVTPTITAGLKDRVVRVSLHDAQVDTAKNLEPGDFITMRNLRLKPSGRQEQLSGRLGGSQRLINKLKANGNGNAELKSLLARRSEWESRAKKRKGLPQLSSSKDNRTSEILKGTTNEVPTQTALPLSSLKLKGYRSLKDVQDSDICPNKFLVRARVVDFIPEDLRDATVLHCTQCDKDIPKSRRLCTNCDDAMKDDTSVQPFYRLFFRIQDEEGTQLDISASDEECSLLKDLEPADFYEDDEAFGKFVDRIKPLVGDLLEVSKGEACLRVHDVVAEGFSPTTPLLDLTIGSWPIEKKYNAPVSRAYIMMHHALVV
ncbi:hypothetical protein A0H81_14324 [Grifola frondosa]|uniref:Protection of telomeres protein 1 ssDNA-binding domain-containing protein n=1 Tax=Grifola frondosa TaxID=5627 RepID=A0A1C7LLX2_GRIFR|nr:hypothetical protein A0H81_14324 [Grifola frondosa]